MRKLELLSGLAALALSTAPAMAGEILQDQANGQESISFYQPGQSFTAIDTTLTSIGFGLAAFNIRAETDSFTVTLLAGDGPGGAPREPRQARRRGP